MRGNMKRGELSSRLSIEQQIRRQKRDHAAALKLNTNKEVYLNSLDELIKELYTIKREIRDTCSRNVKSKHILANKKDSVLFQIKKELAEVGKDEANKIKAKLWEELGVTL
ncbi:MAG: hypothetical protein ACRD38_10355 [Nitrososphaerales archaeon]